MPSKNNFSAIFSKNEYRELAGNRQIVLVRLTLLLVLTFLALGFSVGGLQQLKERMENPFTNWVDLKVTPYISDQLPEIRDFVREQDFMDKFHLQGTGSWSKYWLRFSERNHDAITCDTDTLTKIGTGRTVDFMDDLFAEIVNDKSTNLLHRNDEYFNEEGEVTEPCGLVVTGAFLLALGYEPHEFPSIKRLGITQASSTDYMVFVRLLAVVNQLPSFCDFISSKRVYSIFQGNYYDYIVRNRDSTKIQLLSKSPEQVGLLKKKVMAELGLDAEDFDLAEEHIPVDSLREYFSYTIYISRTRSTGAQQVRQFVKSCKTDAGFNDFSYLECGEDSDVLDQPNSLTFNFADLEEIRPFQATLNREFDIELSMENVNSKENFQMVARLTSIMGLILFAFGLVSILLFLGNLIQNHISRIKPNLGTFKAMGLPNGQLLNTYSEIVVRMMLVCVALAFPVALVLGWGLDSRLKIGFELFHGVIPIVILLMLLVVFVLVRKILNKALAGSPGDLIYERE